MSRRRNSSLSPVFPSLTLMPHITTSRTSSVNSNANRGILVLPMELISATLKNYKKIEIHSTANESAPFVLPRDYSIRPGVLRSLSQVCQVYREFFLPLAYESLDTCLHPKSGNDTRSHHRHVGDALERKCAGMLVSPGLCEMVSQVNVSLTTYKDTTALPLFIACLAALPNLRTIKILHATASLMKPIRDAFKEMLSISFPTVHNIAIREPCHGFMFALPEVRTIWMGSDRDPTQIATSMINAGCQKVEVLRNFDLWDSTLTRLLNKTPMLRRITLSISNDKKYFDILKRCKKLDTIELRMTQVYFEKAYHEPTLDQPEVVDAIKACRAILNASPSTERKSLRLLEVGPSPRAPGLEQGEMSYVDVGLE